MKYLLLMLTFLAVSVLPGKEVAVFSAADPSSAYSAVSGDRIVSSPGKTQRFLEASHPLVRIYSFCPVSDLSGKNAGFISDSFLIRDGKKIYCAPPVPVVQVLLLIIFGVGFFALIYQQAVHGNIPGFWLLLPLVLRLFLVLLTTAVWNDVFPAASDEPGYFKTMNDILHGIWTSPWSFTVGTGFLYLPFMLLTGAGEFYDLVPIFNYFSALVIAPGCMALLYWIMKKLGAAPRTAGLLLFFWAVYPFFVFHLEHWGSGVFQAFFAVPLWKEVFDYWNFYAFCINAGFNAMSDTPGLLLLLSATYFTLRMPEKKSAALLAGLLFGITCLFRINYILLAPFFALLLFDRFRGSRRKLLTAAAWSVAGFLIGFLVQFIANTLQFGSPLTFGYVLHYTELAPLERPAAGFTWHTFAKLTNLRQLLGANLPVWAAGCAAMWCTKDRFRQWMLILWSVPLIFFFAGYSHTGCDARRFVFPVFCAMLTAAGTLELWKECGKKELLILLVPMWTLLLFGVPYGGIRGVPFLLGEVLWLKIVQLLLIPLVLAGVIILLKKRRVSAGIFLLLTGLFFVFPALLAAGLLLLPVYAAARSVDVQRFIKHSAAVEDLSGKKE